MARTVGEADLLARYNHDRLEIAKAVIRGEEKSQHAAAACGSFWIAAAEAALRLEPTKIEHALVVDDTDVAIDNLLEAAVRWWKSKKPLGWEDSVHGQQPSVGCFDSYEADLAREVAIYLRSLGQVP